VIRRNFVAVLSLAGFAALAPLHPICGAMAQSATAGLAIEPVSLPDMALGPRDAAVTIVEYSSMTCSHCATFAETSFPMLRSKYIDTGRVRFVFREFPLDQKSAAASMLARCAANGDAGKYFGIVDTLFRQQDQLSMQTMDTLKRIGAQNGMSDQAVEACLKDQTLLDQLTADRKIGNEVVGVDRTPTFFINGEKSTGVIPFADLDRKIMSLIRR
jgi:protein-disulfide isomerase